MNRGCLGGVKIGDGHDVAIMGTLNVSPESFYPGSVQVEPGALARAAEAMVEAGAAILDVGAMSTAPYLDTVISAAEERDRLAAAVELLASKLGVPISADTSRALPARAALAAGARIVNDVSGLKGDPELGGVVAEARAGLVLMAAERSRETPRRSEGNGSGAPAEVVRRLLEESLTAAREAGVPADHVAIDPGIGFFRQQSRPWHEWDCHLLAHLDRLRDLGRPLCVGVSRKSFIGALTGAAEPSARLPGSLAATALAVLGGAHLIRTHDVAETRQAVRVAEAIRDARQGRQSASDG